MSLHNWLRLALTDGLGPILIRRLIDHAGSADNAVAMKVADLRQIEGIGAAKAQSIYDSLQQTASLADEQLCRAAEFGASILSLEDPAYPELLKTINDPPPLLYVKGDFQPRDLHSVAIVGSRRCSHYGREQAERFASLLAGAGVSVISGGARGIDSAAHRGAMRHPQGRTVAILGSGLDVPYPPENKGLFEQIAQHGAVASEFPFGTPPSAEHFPRRNRIVSGLSRGVLVIEADLRSGALITARLANEDHGRPVFALPGRVDNAMSAGPHQLIRDGATLVTCLEEILEGLDPLPDSVHQSELFDTVEAQPAEPAAAPAMPPNLTERQILLLGQLGPEPTSVDQLIERTGLDAGMVLQELTFLSLKGLVRRLDGQTYARRR